MPDTIANADYTLVQTVTTLPALDSGWTSRPELIALRGTEGVGQFVGSMEVELRSGVRTLPWAGNTVATQAIASYIGQYLRVLYHNQSTGTITVSGKKYDCLWTGVVVSQTTVPDGATTAPGGTQVFHCAGVASILDNIYINQGISYGWLSGVATGPWDPGFCPLFNAMPSKNNNTFGERSLSTVSLTGTSPLRNVYVFDLVAPNSPWTALQVIDHLLANFAQVSLPPAFTYSGPSWTITDPLNCLAYVPDKLDFTGKPLLECINSLINPRRGCTWRATMNANAIVITVYSTAQTAITSGAFTFPASTTTNTLDSRGNQLIGGLTINEDVSAKFDYIQVESVQPLTAISLYFKVGDAAASLQKGWTSADEADWLLGKTGPQYQHVWRRFILRDDWDGGQYKGSTTIGLRNSRTTSASGYTGARVFDNTVLAAPAKILQLEALIPLPANQDYSSTPAANALDMTAPLLAPMVFIKDGIYSNIGDRFSASVEENPAAVVIEGDQDELYSYLTAAAAEMVVTLGVREAHPLMVAWKSAAFTGEVPRVMVRRIPYCEQWVALEGAVMSVNSTGTAFQVLTATRVVVDDIPKLSSWLAMLQTWYGYTAVTATWTDHSKIDYASGNGTYQPGSLLTTVHRGDTALACNAVISTRAWDFTLNGFGTTYTTERVIPDVASIETHPRVNKVFREKPMDDFDA